MIGEPLDSHRQKRPLSPWSIVVGAAGIIAVLLILRPWQVTDGSQLALVIRETGTSLPPAATPAAVAEEPSATLTSVPSTSTPPPTPSQTALPPAQEATYTVKSGDTLGFIAREHGVTVSIITQANDIAVDAILSVGQVLVIPLPAHAPAKTPVASGSATAQSAASTPTSAVEEEVAVYEVEAGDVLSAIAAEFDVPMGVIVEENNLENPEMLVVGMSLLIPLGTSTPLPTDTPMPTPTPTEGPPFRSPAPLGPADRQAITADSVLLNWSSVGILSDGEWYLVRLWSGSAPEGRFVAEEWTQGTSWRIGRELRDLADTSSGEYYWTVIVAHREAQQEQTGRAEWVWEALSPESEVRWFIWLPEPTATPP